MTRFKYSRWMLPALLLLFLLQLSQKADAQKDSLKDTELATFLPATAPKKPIHPRNILIFNCPKSYYHAEAISVASHAFEMMGEKTKAYSTTVSSDPSIFTTEGLGKVDAVLLHNASGNFWGEPQQVEVRKRVLIQFVRGGKGLIAIHATTAFDNEPNMSANTDEKEFREMIGGSLVQHPFNYDELTPLTIKVEDPKHPLNAAFGGQSKWLLPFRDEIFQFAGPFSRDKQRVLLSLSLEETPDKGSDPNKDYPLAWIKNFGKGRVFYSAFGHSGDSFKDSKMLTFLLSGIQFALGDLKADLKPVPQIKTDLEKGFVSLFNGKNLDGWRGECRIWSVEDNCITGQTTNKEHVERNNYLIWDGGQLKDFDLKVRFKLVNGNSGIYFHSFERTPDSSNPETLVGVQADFAADPTWVGTIMEYTLREVLAARGRKVVINEEGKRINAGSVADPDELLKVYKANEWNDYHVIVRDNLIVLRINDVEMSELRDYDKKRLVSGLLALQVHVGSNMKVQFKDILLKKY